MEQNNDDTINTDQGSHKFCCSTNWSQKQSDKWERSDDETTRD